MGIVINRNYFHEPMAILESLIYGYGYPAQYFDLMVRKARSLSERTKFNVVSLEF
jgi:hypothetical protein